MAFIDDLTLVLDLLILITAVVFYTGGLVWFESFRRKDLARANSHLQAGALLLGILGGLLGLISVWGELVWPLPGSYNLFFFDVTTMLSLLLIAFAVTVRLRMPTHLVGLLSVIIGLAVMFYGVRAYQLAPGAPSTKDPLETLLMYLAFGGVAVMAYPATLYLDWFVVGPTVPGADPLPSPPIPNYPWLWRVLLGLFMLAVFLAGFAAVAYGVNTAWSHLGSPP